MPIRCQLGVAENPTADREKFPSRMEKFRAPGDAIPPFLLEYRHPLLGALVACLSASPSMPLDSNASR